MKVEWEARPSCPICGSHKRVHHHYEKGGNNPPCTFYACGECHVIWQDPAPSPAFLEKYYLSKYRDRGDGAGVQQINLDEEKDRGQLILKRIERYKKKVYRHLDVGSSTGTLLGLAQDRFGCASIGIEPNVNFGVNSMSRFHGRVHRYLYNATGEYDLITCIHTLEHVFNPIAFLLLIERRLQKRGLLLIEVPFQRRKTLRFPHLFVFSTESLHLALAAAGLFDNLLETDRKNIWAYVRK